MDQIQDGLEFKILTLLYLKNKILKEEHKNSIKLQEVLSGSTNLAITTLKASGFVIGNDLDDIQITAIGIAEFELRYLNPVQSTNVTIVQVSQMLNSVIQQSSPSSSITFSRDQVEEIKGFIKNVDTNVDLQIIENALTHGKLNSDLLVHKYYNNLLERLNDFKINNFLGAYSQNPWDNQIVAKLELMLGLRNEFLSIFKCLIDNTNDKEDLIHELLNKLLQFNALNFNTDKNLAGYLVNEHYKFLVYEIYLHVTTYIVKKENFKYLAYILHHPYQVNIIDKHNGIDDYYSWDFTYFNMLTDLINDEKRRSFLNVYDPYENLISNLVIERVNSDVYIDKDTIKQTDILLYYISLFTVYSKTKRRIWMPYLSTQRVDQIRIMKKAVSKTFFEKIKPVFHVSDFEDYKIKYRAAERNYLSQQGPLHYFRIPEIDIIMNPDYLNLQA